MCLARFYFFLLYGVLETSWIDCYDVSDSSGKGQEKRDKLLFQLFAKADFHE